MKKNLLLGLVLIWAASVTVQSGVAYSQNSEVKKDLPKSGEWEEGLAGAAGAKRLSPEGYALKELVPAGLSILYMFSGITDDGEQGSASRREASSIHCTNIGTTNTQVEVQVFQWNGTDVFTGTVNMPPLRTYTYSTQNTTIYFDDVILGGSPGTPPIFQGSGRVLASHPDVICAAQVLDPLNYPPSFMSGLPIYGPSGVRRPVVVIPMGE